MDRKPRPTTQYIPRLLFDIGLPWPHGRMFHGTSQSPLDRQFGTLPAFPRASSDSRGSCSFQFGRASAPTIPQLVHTIRGINEGTVSAPGR